MQNENSPLEIHSMNPSLLLFKLLIIKNQDDPFKFIATNSLGTSVEGESGI